MMKISCKNKVEKLIIYDSFSKDIKELSRGISEDYFLIGDDKHNALKT